MKEIVLNDRLKHNKRAELLSWYLPLLTLAIVITTSILIAMEFKMLVLRHYLLAVVMLVGIIVNCIIIAFSIFSKKANLLCTKMDESEWHDYQIERKIEKHRKWLM